MVTITIDINNGTPLKIARLANALAAVCHSSNLRTHIVVSEDGPSVRSLNNQMDKNRWVETDDEAVA